MTWGGYRVASALVTWFIVSGCGDSSSGGPHAPLDASGSTGIPDAPTDLDAPGDTAAPADASDGGTATCVGDAEGLSCCCDGTVETAPFCDTHGALACQSGSSLHGESDCNCINADSPCCAAATVQADGGDAGSPSCDGGPLPYAVSASPVCGAYTLGVGTLCDECVGAHCITPNDECCHRGQYCGDPRYEYRIGISRCIASFCAAPCDVACEGWPLSPL